MSRCPSIYRRVLVLLLSQNDARMVGYVLRRTNQTTPDTIIPSSTTALTRSSMLVFPADDVVAVC